ncbi:hypothetical protein DITRI_Ditri12bG0009900 [Diplodiscus trichospermus]
MEESDGSGSSKHSGRHLELVVGSRNNRHLSEGSGSSKHSSRHLELDYEARCSEHSRKHLELDVETRSSKHSDNYPHVRNEGIGSNLFEINLENIKGWGNNKNLETHPEAIDGSESSKISKFQEEIDKIEGDILVSTEKLRLSSSSFSSSSGLSTDYQLQAYIKLSKSRSGITYTSSPKPDEDTQQSLKHHGSGNNSSKLEDCQNGAAGPTLTSQVSSITHESTLTQSPPIQVMDRKAEFDPYRISPAVFARSKSTTSTDRSIASNDSLFSIQVENNSFSRDHILNLKSGELFKSCEFIVLSPSPVAQAVDTDKKSVELEKAEASFISDDAVKDKTVPNAEEPNREKPTHPTVSWNSSTICNHSDDCRTSVPSFAFPISAEGRMFPRKKRQSSSYNKNEPWLLQNPKNQLAATLAPGFLPLAMAMLLLQLSPRNCC